MTRHPQLDALVKRLREEHPRPTMRWSELVERVRRERDQAGRRSHQTKS
jgi:hypothetical protein